MIIYNYKTVKNRKWNKFDMVPPLSWFQFLVKLRRWFFKSNRKRDRSSFIFYGNYSVLYYCTLFINSTLENYFSLVNVTPSFFIVEKRNGLFNLYIIFKNQFHHHFHSPTTDRQTYANYNALHILTIYIIYYIYMCILRHPCSYIRIEIIQ